MISNFDYTEDSRRRNAAQLWLFWFAPVFGALLKVMLFIVISAAQMIS